MPCGPAPAQPPSWMRERPSTEGDGIREIEVGPKDVWNMRRRTDGIRLCNPRAQERIKILDVLSWYGRVPLYSSGRLRRQATFMTRFTDCPACVSHSKHTAFIVIN